MITWNTKKKLNAFCHIPAGDVLWFFKHMIRQQSLFYLLERNILFCKKDKLFWIFKISFVWKVPKVILHWLLLLTTSTRPWWIFSQIRKESTSTQKVKNVNKFRFVESVLWVSKLMNIYVSRHKNRVAIRKTLTLLYKYQHHFNDFVFVLHLYQDTKKIQHWYSQFLPGTRLWWRFCLTCQAST